MWSGPMYAVISLAYICLILWAVSVPRVDGGWLALCRCVLVPGSAVAEFGCASTGKHKESALGRIYGFKSLQPSTFLGESFYLLTRGPARKVHQRRAQNEFYEREAVILR